MSKFIELHTIYNGMPYLINVDSIVEVHGTNGICYVQIDGESLDFRESYEQVREMIYGNSKEN